jgi:hypothetical protein
MKSHQLEHPLRMDSRRACNARCLHLINASVFLRITHSTKEINVARFGCGFQTSPSAQEHRFSKLKNFSDARLDRRLNSIVAEA